MKNTLVYGGEWVLAPGGAADDGLFEMVPVCGLADFGSKMVSSKVGSPIGEYELHQPGAAAPPAAQIDGEELPAGDRFRIDVLARILRLMVPAA